MKAITDQIHRQVSKAVELLASTDGATVSPSTVASFVCAQIDPRSEVDPCLRHAAFMQFQQYARTYLRGKSGKAAPSDIQEDMFDGTLQDRYPCNRGGEEVYVLREHMTLLEFQRNADRLQKIGQSLIRHSRALLKEAARLVSKGHFGPVSDQEAA